MSSSVGAGGLQAECRHGQLQQCQELLLGGITLQPDSGDYAPGQSAEMLGEGRGGGEEGAGLDEACPSRSWRSVA